MNNYRVTYWCTVTEKYYTTEISVDNSQAAADKCRELSGAANTRVTKVELLINMAGEWN